MKKNLRKIRKIVFTLIGLTLFLISVGYLIYQTSFSCPRFVIERIKSFTLTFYDLDFDVSSIYVNFSTHTVNVRGLSLKLPQEKPFIKVDQVDLYAASGTGVLDVYLNRSPFERIDLKNVYVDDTAPFPAATEGEIPFASIPATSLTLVKLSVLNKFGLLDFKDFDLKFVRNGKTGNVIANVAKGPFGGIGKIASLIDFSSGKARVNFNWVHSNFQQFIPFGIISHYYGVSIKKGNINLDFVWEGILGKRLANPTENLTSFFSEELSGHFYIKDCQVEWAGLKGDLDLYGSRVGKWPWKLHLNAHNKISLIEVNSDWLGDKNDFAKFKAEVKAKNLELTPQIYNMVGMPLNNTNPGQINFSGNVEGGIEGVVGSGSAIATGWKYKGKLIRKAEVDWVFKGQELDLEGDFRTEIGDLALSWQFFPFGEKKGQGKVEGEVNDLSLKVFDEFVSGSLDGKCSGPFKIKFDLNQPASTTYSIDLSVLEPDIFSIRPLLFKGKLFGEGQKWILEDPSADFSDGGKINLKGQISHKGYSGNLSIKKVRLDELAVPIHIASGTTSLEGKLSGELDKPELLGEVWAGKVGIMGQVLSSFKAQIKLDQKSLELSPMVMIPTNEGMIDGYFSVNIETGKINSFKLNLQGLSIDFIGPFLPDNFKSTALSGRVSGSVSFDGQREKEYWDFLINGRNLEMAEQPLDSVFIEGSIWGDQGEIRHLFVRAFGGTIKINGEVQSKTRFAGSIEAESLFLNKATFLQNLFPGLRGEINLQGDIVWDKEEKNGLFTIFGEKMRVNERDLGNMGCEVIVDNQGLEVIQGEFDKLGVKLTGSIDWKGRKPYKAKMELKQVDLSFLPQIHGVEGFDYGGLVVDGKCSMTGDLASLTPDIVEMDLSSLKIQKENDVIVANKPMKVVFQNDSIEIRSLELKYRQGILGIEGIYSPGKNAALVLNGKDFSIKAIGSLFNLPDWDYDGRLSLDGGVFGNYPDFDLKADARIDELKIKGRVIPSIVASMEGNRNKFEVKEVKVNLPNNYFFLKGFLEFSGLTDIKNINLDFTVPKGPISDLPTYLPDVFREASGTLNASLKLTGNPNSPVIIGEVNLKADELGFKGMKKPFTNLNFDISTHDNILKFDSLNAKLGRGKIQGSGEVNFRDGPGSITAKISGEKIDLSFLNFEIYKASSSVTIGGNLYNPEIKGNVIVPRGKFHINTDLLAERPTLDLFFNSLKYDIDVEVPRNFWLKSSFLNAEMRGKFSILGDLEKVNLDGGIECVQGWLYFQRRKFRIETGDIKFGGVEESFDPHIYIKSEGQVQNTQVFLTLQGRVSSFTPKIYSSPPMSEGDLLALLTIGRDLTTAMNSDSKEIFENEILEGLKNSYISALLGNTLSTALNLDELFLTSLFDKTSGKSVSFLRVGKYIGNNLFLAYEGTMRDDENETYIFEYRLPRGFVVNLEFEKPENDKRIGVRYDWKFW